MVSESLITTQVADCSQIADWSEAVGWEVEYQQVGRGTFDGTFAAAACGELKITQQYCSRELAAIGTPPAGMVSILLPCFAAGGTVIQGKVLGRHDACVMAPRSQGFLRSPAHLGMCTVSVPHDTLEAALWAYGRYEFPPWLASCHITPFPQDVINELMIALRTVPSSTLEGLDSRVLQAVEDQILQTICSGICAGESAAGSANRAKYFARARDFIDAHLTDALNVGEVARQVGVSRRTLELAFREVAGTSVVEYIRTLRLNRARKILMARSKGSIPVSDAAAQCGLLHFGYFSRDYKRLFGELPSHTLGRGSL